MSTKSLGSITRAAAVACIGLLCYAGAASSAVFRAHIDPPLWFGDGLFEVASDCILPGTGFMVPGDDCGAVDILDIVITSQTDPLSTIRFAGSPILTNSVTGLDWIAGVLTGIDTVLLYSQGTTGTFFDNSGGYTLQYISGHTQENNLPIANLRCVVSETSFSSRSISVNDYESELGQCAQLVADGPGHQLAAVLVDVPEPGSLALLFGALGAGWMIRRKSRAA